MFKMSQVINFPALFYFPWVRFVRKNLTIPHLRVRDISRINPEKLKQCGIKGIVFDKDNTLTIPYESSIHPRIQESFKHFCSVYKDQMVICSNFAGTKDDLGYKKARKIEDDLGISVLRHKQKKPGGIECVRDYFDCSLSELVVFGDRIITDVVFANKYGMLSILTEPLTEKENKAISKTRAYEVCLIDKFIARGIKAPKHKLDYNHICIKNFS